MTTDHQTLKAQLKELIVTGLRLHDVAPDGIDDDQAIFVEGLGLDSIDALELVVLVEERFGIAIPDEEVGKRVFASISALAAYVSSEQGHAGT
jgi:acyl carrier protein